MKERMKKFYAEKKYIIYMIIFLVLFHGICNFNIRMISFSSDEYIPLSIAAKLSGLDWMNSRNFNYYYGYVTLLFFIPVFKIPFIYRNSFLLTQILLAINSLFHILATVFIYLSACLLFEGKKDKKVIAIISVISSCSLQIFNVSMGIQVEALFVLAYAICFYCIVKVSKDKAGYKEMIALGFFSYVAIANNSRGYVLLISIFMCLAMVCFQGKKYWKYMLCFIISAVVFVSIHKYLINPYYSTLFSSNAHNTTSQPIVENFKLVMTDFEHLKNFIRAFIGWMWSSQLSTLGLFFIVFIMALKEYIEFFKTRDWKKIVVPSFIVLNIIGISILCITMFMNGIMNGGLTTRADMLFYVRYFVGILIASNVYALYGLVEKKVFVKKWEKILYIVLTIISGILAVRFVAYGVLGTTYGVNNTVVLSLFTNWFDGSYRYGAVDFKSFCYMAIFIAVVAVIIVALQKEKKWLLSFLAVLTIVACLVYDVKIADKKSTYYDTVFAEEIIAECNKDTSLSIYASDFATTLQYFVPDGKVYYYFDNQDLIVLTDNKLYWLDQSEYEYEPVVKADRWTVFRKTGNIKK